MGMYTELALSVTFLPSTPPPLLTLLERLCDPTFGVGTSVDDDIASLQPLLAALPVSLRDHPFFSTDRWSWCLRSGGSHYFSTQPHCHFKRPVGTIGKDACCSLLVWTNIKNYDSEWEHFLSLIAPFCWPDYAGHLRYEEATYPTQIHICGPGDDEDPTPRTLHLLEPDRATCASTGNPIIRYPALPLEH